jgi:hypothetical protein
MTRISRQRNKTPIVNVLSTRRLLSFPEGIAPTVSVANYVPATRSVLRTRGATTEIDGTILYWATEWIVGSRWARTYFPLPPDTIPMDRLRAGRSIDIAFSTQHSLTTTIRQHQDEPCASAVSERASLPTSTRVCRWSRRALGRRIVSVLIQALRDEYRPRPAQRGK